jgi:hypothetical protein
MKVLGLNRAELLVNDADGAQAVFETLFNGGCYAPDSGVHGRPQDCRVNYQHGLELVHPFGTDHRTGQLLAERGEHVFTVVWDVNDMEIAKAHLAANGFEVQWEHDFGPHGDLEVHKQLVIRPDRTHGLLVIFQERRMRA